MKINRKDEEFMDRRSADLGSLQPFSEKFDEIRDRLDPAPAAAASVRKRRTILISALALFLLVAVGVTTAVLLPGEQRYFDREVVVERTDRESLEDLAEFSGILPGADAVGGADAWLARDKVTGAPVYAEFSGEDAATGAAYRVVALADATYSYPDPRFQDADGEIAVRGRKFLYRRTADAAVREEFFWNDIGAARYYIELAGCPEGESLSFLERCFQEQNRD